MLEIGSVVAGMYKILNVIGRGGMSVVYLAMNERANKQWAVKEIVRKSGADLTAERKEIEMMKRLRHPNLPAIIDVIEQEDSLLIVMDYVEGRSLEAILQEYGPQPQEMVVQWAGQLCDVLLYLHTRRPAIIYRDMKPANVMLKPDGREIALIDFGAAKEYNPDRIKDTVSLGTRGYAAPEQYAEDGKSDVRTDIYCLGVMLFQLLTGECPHSLRPITQVNAALSQGLEKIIVRCTQVEKERRYQSCAQLLYDLEHYRDLEQKNRRRRRQKIRLFAAMLWMSLLCGLAGAGAYWKEAALRRNTYEAYLLAAQSSASVPETVAYYQKAIRTEPGKETAYLQLLEQVFLADNNLTAQEDEQLRTLLYDTGPGGVSYEALLAENTKGYAAFAYRLGLAYFYCYEDDGNKNLSVKWLQIAADAKVPETGMARRAEKLLGIARYYTRIGVADKAGDASISYKDYWADLSALAQGDIAAEDNITTAMMVYRELIGQIYVHAPQFCSAGVEKDVLLGQLNEVRRRLEQDIVIPDDVNRERNQHLKDTLLSGLSQAGKQVDTAFGVAEQSGEKGGGVR